MVWAPGWNTEVAGNHIDKDGKLLSGIKMQYFAGTSAAKPFVTGVVSLMVSRNPNLSPKEVKDILLASDGPSIVPHPKMAAAGISANLLDVQKVMENPVLWPNNGGVPDPAQTFFGLVQADKTIRYNTMVAGPVKGITPPLTLLKTVSEDVWKDLGKDALAKIKGWYGINAGDQPVSATEFEVLQADKGCAVPTAGTCAGVKLSFAPKLTSGTVTPLPLAAGAPTGT